MVILPFSLSGRPGKVARKRSILALAAAFSSLTPSDLAIALAIHRETLTPALPASAWTRRRS